MSAFPVAVASPVESHPLLDIHSQSPTSVLLTLLTPPRMAPSSPSIKSPSSEPLPVPPPPSSPAWICPPPPPTPMPPLQRLTVPPVQSSSSSVLLLLPAKRSSSGLSMSYPLLLYFCDLKHCELHLHSLSSRFFFIFLYVLVLPSRNKCIL